MGNKVGGLSLTARLFRAEEVSEDRLDKIWNLPGSFWGEEQERKKIGVED